jgi:GcrA cell cycle regulator
MFSSFPTKTAPNARAARGARCPPAWTPERERRAVRLYLVEGFTAADVAGALGPPFTRAAVIGKMRRLGCLKRKVRALDGHEGWAGRKPRRCASPRAERRLPPRRPPQPLPPLREIGPTGSPAPLACLPPGACRWPIDDPGSGRMHLALFCGGPAAADVYCAAHRALAVRRPS